MRIEGMTSMWWCLFQPLFNWVWIRRALPEWTSTKLTWSWMGSLFSCYWSFKLCVSGLDTSYGFRQAFQGWFLHHFHLWFSKNFFQMGKDPAVFFCRIDSLWLQLTIIIWSTCSWFMMHFHSFTNTLFTFSLLTLPQLGDVTHRIRGERYGENRGQGKSGRGSSVVQSRRLVALVCKFREHLSLLARPSARAGEPPVCPSCALLRLSSSCQATPPQPSSCSNNPPHSTST